jgi:excisionase family DNA binding protein
MLQHVHTREFAEPEAPMTLTVPEAAQRVGRNPETIRRWIREGKLPSRKIGTQHLIEERDLNAVIVPDADRMPLPAAWQRTITGEPMPDWLALIRQARSRR